MAKKKTGNKFLDTGDYGVKKNKAEKQSSSSSSGKNKVEKATTVKNTNKAVKNYSSTNMGGSQYSVKNASNIKKQEQRTTTPKANTNSVNNNVKNHSTTNMGGSQYSVANKVNKDLEQRRQSELDKNRQKREYTNEQMRNQKSGLDYDKKALDTRMTNLTKGTAKQIAGGHLTSLGHDSNDANEFKKSLDQMVLDGKIDQETADKNYESYLKSNTKANRDQDWKDTKLHKTFQKIEQKGIDLNAKGDAQVQKGMEGLKGGKKLLADAYTSGVGMLSDMAFGPAWAGSMMSRSFGNELNSKRGLVESGIITEKEAENNAGLQALKEVGTEYMFTGFGLAKNLKGVGAFTESLDAMKGKALDNLTSKISNKVLKNIAYSGLKGFAGYLEEGVEEIAGGILEPRLSNLAYANKVDKRMENSFREGLLANSSDINTQIDYYVSQGYDRDSIVNAYAEQIMGEENYNDMYNSFLESGMSDKQAKKMATAMQNYMVANLNGDKKAMQKAENEMLAKYNDAFSVKEKFSAKDTFEAAASAMIMASLTGGVGHINTTAKGMIAKQTFSNVEGAMNAASAISNMAMGLSDEKMAARAKAMYESAQNGNDLALEQYAELQDAIQKQTKSDAYNSMIAQATGTNLANKQRYFAKPQVEMAEDGSFNYIGEVTNQRASDIENKVRESFNQYSEAYGDVQSEDASNLASNITAIELGFINAEAVANFTTNHPEARAIYESVAGVTLPETNQATRDFLFKRSAANYENTARLETINTVDSKKGQLDVQYANSFGSEGQEVFQNLSQNIGLENSTDYVAYATAMGKVYDAGVNGLSMEEAMRLAEDGYAISSEDAELMYKAGATDKTIKKSGGTVKYEVSDAAKIKSSEREAFGALARAFNVNIKVTDNLTTGGEVEEDGVKKSVGQQVNGQYDPKTNTITLNLNKDVRVNVGYTLMHEFTHSIKEHFPSEYDQFAKLFKERWENNVGAEEVARIIKAKQDAYKRVANQDLTKDEALEEIICDQMGEVLHDTEFLNKVAEENPNVAQALLYSIRDILRKIRQVFATYGGFPSKYNGAMLSQLDMLKEAETLLSQAMDRASEIKTQEVFDRDSGVRDSVEVLSEADIDNKIHYSVSRMYPFEVDSVVDYSGDKNNFVYRSIYMGMTPQVLLDIGFPDLPIGITSKHLYLCARKNGIFTGKSEHYHNLGKNKMVNLLNEIEHPALIIVSKGHHDRVLIFDGTLTKPNQPIGMVLSYSDKGDFNGVQLLTNHNNTDFGFDQQYFDDAVKHALNNNGVLYYDKKRGQALPLSTSRYNSVNSLSKDDLKKNVALFKASVNNKFPHPNKVIKSKEEILKQTMDRVEQRFPDTTVGRAFKKGIDKSIRKDMKLSIDTEYFDAIDSGDMDKVRQMVLDRANERGFTDAVPEQTLSYKTRVGKPPQITKKCYKVFTVDNNGNPSALFVSGVNPLPQNVWLDAQDTWHFKSTKNGKYYVPSTKNPSTKGGKTGKSMPLSEVSTEDIIELEKRGYITRNKKGELPKNVTVLAYRPGWHAGDLPFFPQGGAQHEGSNYENIHRFNQVVFECELAYDVDYTNKGIIQSGKNKGKTSYKDMQEMPENGGYEFATNPLTNATDYGKWYISSSLKINRALTEEECNEFLAEKGFLPQEWQSFETRNESSSSNFTLGPLDLQKLGYEGEQFDAARKTLAPITYDDNGNIIPLSERFDETKDDIRWSVDSDINESMTMEECRQMIQRCFVIGDIKEWHEGEYANGDEWIRGEGADAVALVAENDYNIQKKYLDKIDGLMEGDFFVEDILEAYLEGTLTGKEKAKAKRLDTSKGNGYRDDRFYAPQVIEDAREQYRIATQKITNSNRNAVTEARAKVLLFAHNEGAEYELGVTRAELNKKLRSWSGYSSEAREVSKRINSNVALENKWTGIENLSWVSRSAVELSELENLVASISGESSEYERNYIARTMLALDTHIDWTDINIEFTNRVSERNRNVRGTYYDKDRKILVKHDSPNTVAHEMGHALDHKWGRDLGFAVALTDLRNDRINKVEDPETKQFLTNFAIFLEGVTDNSSLHNEYAQRTNEAFARFVDKFVRWTEKVATGRDYMSEFGDYNDKFTTAQFVEFAKILQEKAMLDSRKATKNPDKRFSITENMSPDERYEELKDVELQVLESHKSDLPLVDEELENLRNKKISVAKGEAVKLAKDLGVNGVYSNSDVDFDFEFSNSGIKESGQIQGESISKEKYVDFMNLMLNLDSVIKNAHLIEKHNEDYYIENYDKNHKRNKNLKDTYVLVSAFMDEENIIPVKLTIMEYLTRENPKIHVAVATNPIKKSRIITRPVEKPQGMATSIYMVNLSQLLGLVNDKALVKYIPQQFRDEVEYFDETTPDKRYSVDSEGNELSPGQTSFFEESKARDDSNNLLTLYSGTSTAGFNTFYVNDLIWLTTNVKSAASYAGTDPDNIYAPSKDDPEVETKKITYGKKAYYKDLMFDSEEDYSMFAEKFNIENYYTQSELDDDLYDADDYDELQHLHDEVWKEYLSYNRKAKRAVSINEIYWNADKYDLSSLKAVIYEIENGNVEFEEDFDLESFRDYFAFQYENYNDEGESFDDFINNNFDFSAYVRVPEGFEAEDKDIDDYSKVYKLYANVKNPYIVDNKGRRLNASGSIYYDAVEYALQHKDIYDGVIVRNVEVGVPGSGVGDMVGAFYPEQVKSVNNLNPTNNPDIRLSIPTQNDLDEHQMDNPKDDMFLDGDISDEMKARRVKIQDEIAAELAHIIRKDVQYTHGKTLEVKSIKPQITELVRSTMANSENTNKEKRETTKMVMEAAQVLWRRYGTKRDAEGTLNLKRSELAELQRFVMDVSKDVVENTNYIDDSIYNEYQTMRDYIRSIRIEVPDRVKSDIDFAAYRRKNLGRMTLVNEHHGGTSIDVLWDDMKPVIASFVSEEFDLEEIDTQAEMFLAIESALDNTKAYRDAYASEFAQDLEMQFAKDFLNIVLTEGQAWKSFADKKQDYYNERTKQMKARHKEAMREQRMKFQKEIKEVKASEREKRNIQRMKYLQKEAERKQKAREQRQAKKDHKERMRSWKSIGRNYDALVKKLNHPKKELGANIPEEFREALATVLKSFDLQTENSVKIEFKTGKVAKTTLAMRDLRDALSKIAPEDDSGVFLHNGAMFGAMEILVKDLNDRPLRDLNNSELDEIDVLLASIKHAIDNENKLLVKGQKESQRSAGETIIREFQEKISKYGRGYNYTGARGGIHKLLNTSMLTPGAFFKSLGGQMKQMYKNLRYAQDDYIRDVNYLRGFFGDLFKPYQNKKKPGSAIEDWQNDKMSQTITLRNGSVIKMTVAQMMSLYCLSKRSQAMEHMITENKGRGIVLADVTSTKGVDKVLGQKQTNSASATAISYDDVVNIVGMLTKEQKHIADELQKLMNGKLQEWGNETSMQMYGIKLFTEDNYFPIEVSDKEIATQIGNASGIKGNKISNFGFTKPLVENPDKAIVIGDIFDIVADHANKMALYHSYAAALTDFNRVFNYKSDVHPGVTVKSAIQEAYGQDAISFIDNLLADINGQAEARMDGVNDLYNIAFANYKKAAIGANLRVLVQQPTAIVRSLTMIDAKYFVGIPKNLIKERNEMHEHCPIAAWKAWGNYQNDYTRSLSDIMFNKDWNRFDTVTMGMYGFADDMTWAIIWGAVKNEVKDKHPGVKEGSEEFWILCNERASEIFDDTQVVDSVFHRSDAMRQNKTVTKIFTAFMAEPTKTYNMMRSQIVESYRMYQDGDKQGAARGLAKVTTVLILNAAAVSAASAVIDAMRGKGDDDDDETWVETFLRNFWENFYGLGSNSDPLAMIVFCKDIEKLFIDAMDGNIFGGTQNMALEGWWKLAQGCAEFKQKVMTGEESFWVWMFGDPEKNTPGKFLSGLGYVTGIPTYTLVKDLKTVLNKFGLQVYAGDETETETKKADKKESRWFDYNRNPIYIQDGSGFDNFLNRFGYNLTEDEKAERQYNKALKDYKKQVKNLSGEEKDKKVRELATSGYKDAITEGDYDTIRRMRQMVSDLGGNVDDFDEKVSKATVTAYKKCIGGDSDDTRRMIQMRNYLLDQGWSEYKISSDIVYKSDAAREFKAACRSMDKEKMVETLRPLAAAGLTKDDAYKLYKNRNMGNFDKSTTGKLKWATEGTISSDYGYRNCPYHGYEMHEAIDIAAPLGTTVTASDGGTVIFAGYDGSGYGNYIRVQHANGVITQYSHLDYIDVRKGQNVGQGQYIGNVGSTGNSTGPHLDFRVEVNGQFVNPHDYLN